MATQLDVCVWYITFSFIETVKYINKQSVASSAQHHYAVPTLDYNRCWTKYSIDLGSPVSPLVLCPNS